MTMTNFEEAIFNFIMHFLFFVVMFALFCGVLFLLALVVTTVWYFLEEGYKNFKKWRAEQND
jgi:uncharacterized membrane protein